MGEFCLARLLQSCACAGCVHEQPSLELVELNFTIFRGTVGLALPYIQGTSPSSIREVPGETALEVCQTNNLDLARGTPDSPARLRGELGYLVKAIWAASISRQFLDLNHLGWAGVGQLDLTQPQGSSEVV